MLIQRRPEIRPTYVRYQLGQEFRWAPWLFSVLFEQRASERAGWPRWQRFWGPMRLDSR